MKAGIKEKHGMKKACRVVIAAVRALLLAVVVLLLVYNVYVLIARYAYGVGIPKVFGVGSAVVETGSMEPEVGAGDLIFIREQEQYSVGDVITFFDSSRGEYVTHRVILVNENGYTTKGDANNVQDPFTVPQDAVVGKVVGVWRGVGKIIAFLQTPAGMFVLILTAAAVWGITKGASYLIGRKKEKNEESAPGENGGTEEKKEQS